MADGGRPGPAPISLSCVPMTSPSFCRPGSMRSMGMEEKPRRKAWRGGAELRKLMSPGSIRMPSMAATRSVSRASSVRRSLDPIGSAADRRPDFALRQMPGERVAHHLPAFAIGMGQAPHQRIVITAGQEQRHGALIVGGRMAQHQAAQGPRFADQVAGADHVAQAQARERASSTGWRRRSPGRYRRAISAPDAAAPRG